MFNMCLSRFSATQFSPCVYVWVGVWVCVVCLASLKWKCNDKAEKHFYETWQWDNTLPAWLFKNRNEENDVKFSRKYVLWIFGTIIGLVNIKMLSCLKLNCFKNCFECVYCCSCDTKNCDYLIILRSSTNNRLILASMPLAIINNFNIYQFSCTKSTLSIYLHTALSRPPSSSTICFFPRIYHSLPQFCAQYKHENETANGLLEI